VGSSPPKKERKKDIAMVSESSFLLRTTFMRSQLFGRVSGVMVIINKTQKSGMSFVADHIFLTLRSIKQSNTHVLSCFKDAPKIRPADVASRAPQLHNALFSQTYTHTPIYVQVDYTAHNQIYFPRLRVVEPHLSDHTWPLTVM